MPVFFLFSLVADEHVGGTPRKNLPFARSELLKFPADNIGIDRQPRKRCFRKLGKELVKTACKEILLILIPRQQSAEHGTKPCQGPVAVRGQHQGDAVVIPDSQTEAVFFQDMEKGRKGEHDESINLL